MSFKSAIVPTLACRGFCVVTNKILGFATQHILYQCHNLWLFCTVVMAFCEAITFLWRLQCRLHKNETWRFEHAISGWLLRLPINIWRQKSRIYDKVLYTLRVKLKHYQWCLVTEKINVEFYVTEEENRKNGEMRPMPIARGYDVLIKYV